MVWDPQSPGRAILIDLETVLDINGVRRHAVATPGFGALEMFDAFETGLPTLSKDVYALGLTIACIYGGVRHPTMNVDEPILQRPLVDALVRNIPDDRVRAVVRRMTQDDPSNRPSMEQVVDDLEAP